MYENLTRLSFQGIRKWFKAVGGRKEAKVDNNMAIQVDTLTDKPTEFWR